MATGARIAKRTVSDGDADLIYALYRDHLDAKGALIKTEREIFDLLERRDKIMRDMAKTSISAIAETFEIPTSSVYNMVAKFNKRYWERIG